MNGGLGHIGRKAADGIRHGRGGNGLHTTCTAVEEVRSAAMETTAAMTIIATEPAAAFTGNPVEVSVIDAAITSGSTHYVTDITPADTTTATDITVLVRLKQIPENTGDFSLAATFRLVSSPNQFTTIQSVVVIKIRNAEIMIHLACIDTAFTGSKTLEATSHSTMNPIRHK